MLMVKLIKTNLLQIFIIILIINSCSYPEIIRDEQIYYNDFENNNLSKIDGGGLFFLIKLM